MSNPNIQPHRITAMRQAADKAPFDVQKEFHALLDAYEDVETLKTTGEEGAEKIEKVGEIMETLKGLLPKPNTFSEEPLSDDAWAEHLEDLDPSERAAASLAELNRARENERVLLQRIEALEEGIGSAVDDLEPIVSG